MQTIPELASSKPAQIRLCSAATHAGKIKEPNDETNLRHLAKALRPMVSGKEKKTPQDTTSLCTLEVQSRSVPHICFWVLPRRGENWIVLANVLQYKTQSCLEVHISYILTVITKEQAHEKSWTIPKPIGKITQESLFCSLVKETPSKPLQAAAL